MHAYNYWGMRKQIGWHTHKYYLTKLRILRHDNVKSAHISCGVEINIFKKIKECTAPQLKSKMSTLLSFKYTIRQTLTFFFNYSPSFLYGNVTPKNDDQISHELLRCVKHLSVPNLYIKKSFNLRSRKGFLQYTRRYHKTP